MPSRRSAAPREQPLLTSKLARPNLGDQVLDRPRLARALVEHAAAPLALVVADAGYGKTTLLAAAARALHRPVVWYSLMASDADPVVFGRYLLQAFRRDAPRFGKDFERALAEAKPGVRSAEMLGGVFANALATLKGPRHHLVLDDFHEVQDDPGVIAMVSAILRHLPDGVRLWIGTRSMPPLPLERLRARGDVFELHSSHLRFSLEELRVLFRDVYRRPLADDEAAALEEATLGWPTAVHLVHEALDRTPGVALCDVIQELRASPLGLHSYLSAEVYHHLDATTRRLLERTSALTRIDVELAQTLTGARDVRTRLESLVQRGLMRSFGTGTQSTFEFHDLVRRFVHEQIEARDGPDAWRALQAETSRALRHRGEPERALRHAILSGNNEDVVALVREIAPMLLREGRAAALLQYVADLPASLVCDDPELLMARADAYQATGRWDDAARDYEHLLGTTRARGARELECRALLGLGKVLNLRGHHEQVLGMAERGLHSSRGLGIDVRVRLLQMKAAAHYYLGQYQAAVAILDQVRELIGSPTGTTASDHDLMVPTVHNLAIAYAAQGRYREASQEFRAALAHVRGTSSPRAPLYLSNLASLLVELGEVAEARRAAEEGLAAAQRFSNRPQETTCLTALAAALTASGDLDAALATLKRAEELHAELRMDVITADLLALRARIFLARGQYRRAAALLSRAIDHVAERPDAPRLTGYRALLAWCELRAGRAHVARDLLLQVLPAADAGENDDQRMRVHYWLGESQLALGEPDAAAHLVTALELVRERGYAQFLAVQAREEPQALLHAVANGIEIDTCVAALVEAGSGIEEPLLDLIESSPVAIGEAALAVLGEIGGKAALTRVPELARTRRALQPAARTALRNIGERIRSRPAAEHGSGVRLIVFGSPRLEIDGTALPASAWRTQRAFQLLVYLAFRPRGTSRDELLELFWPGRQAAAGRRNFHPTLSYIRSVLPRLAEPPLLRDSDHYRLNPAFPFTTDLWELETALEQARRARSNAEHRDTLERAAALAERPVLEGWYGDWADEIQVGMRDRIERMLLDLGRLRLAAGDIEPALAAFRRAAEIDPFRESTRVPVIECLLQLGNRRAAVVEYERLRTLLRTELDSDPLPETEEAVRRLLGSIPGDSTAEAGIAVSSERIAPQPVVAVAQASLKRPSSGWSS